MSEDINVGEVLEALNNKADIDMENTALAELKNNNGTLTWNGKDVITSNKITNCITEIPQDIKLELNNGTLILKAGSKIYVPNGMNADGSNKFDAVTVPNDVSWEKSTTEGTRLAFYSVGGGFPGIVSTYCYSGDTAKMNSTSAVTYGRFYNTETNKIYVGNSNGGSWVEVNNSLPICIFKNDASRNVTSIDQVFNGFGYIGSTQFVLPGVRGLVPNGRNADGSLKNVEVISEKVITYTRTVNGGPFVLGFSHNDVDNGFQHFISSEIQPTSGYYLWYKPSENLIYRVAQGVVDGIYEKCVYGTEVRNTASPYNITSFQPKTTFHAVDYNDAVKYSDKAEVVGWGMPNYSAGMSRTHGTTYKAETNLLFCYSCNSAEYTVSDIQVSSNGSNWISLGQHKTVGGGGNDIENVGQIFVPKGWYYRATGGGAAICVAYPLIGG